MLGQPLATDKTSSLNHDHGLIEMPLVVKFRATAANLVGKGLTKLLGPNGWSYGDVDFFEEYYLLDILIA